MDSFKIKNFIILVLALVNAALLGLLITDAARERSIAAEAVGGVVEQLASHGISVSEDADLSARSLPTLSVARNLESEARAVSNLLGGVSVSDQGGNIMFYSGSLGEARFRGTGGVEILLHSGEFGSGGDVLGAARSFASRLGLETLPEPLSWDIDPETNEGSLELGCCVDGVRVIDSTLLFTVAAGEIRLVYGTRPLDDTAAETGRSSVDVPTALMRFLSLVLERGQVCSRIDELELCYSMSANAAGEGELTPVWRIASDTGEFYINAVTGLEESAA